MFDAVYPDDNTEYLKKSCTCVVHPLEVDYTRLKKKEKKRNVNSFHISPFQDYLVHTYYF